MCRCCYWDLEFDRRRWKFAKAKPSLRAEACRTDRLCRARARIAGAQRLHATACVSTPAASANFLDTSACFRAPRPSSSPLSSIPFTPAKNLAKTTTPSPRSPRWVAQQVFDLTEPITHSLHRQRHHRAQLLGIHVPRRHRLQPRIAECAHVLRCRDPPVRYRGATSTASASGRSCWKSRVLMASFPSRRNRHASATSSARWAWATPTSARC